MTRRADRPPVVGLTGGIATGKSSVARMLRELGAVVIDADMLAREAVRPGTPGYHAVIGRFGTDLVQPDGSIDRKALGTLVFSDPAARRDLEGIIHPLVVRDSQRLMHEAFSRPHTPAVVLEVPLLFESGMDTMADEVWLTTAPPQEQLQRITDRDGLSPEQAAARVKAQMPQEEKIRRAQVCIDTSGSVELTYAQVLRHWRRLLSQESPKNQEKHT